MKTRSLAVALVLFAGSCFAADVDGKWTGSMTGPDGDIPVSITLKPDGAMLTGSTAGPDGTEVKIANGTADGNNISFSVTFDFGGMPFTLNYKGIVNKDQIRFTIDIAGMPVELTLKRAS
jgi:hypothetical protein